MDSRLPDPELFRQGGFRLASRLFIEGDIRGDARQVARLREFAQVQDGLADDVVAWMAGQTAALLASLLSLSRLFSADFADGTLEQIALSPRPLPALVSGKIAAHWLTSGLPLVLLASNVDPAGPVVAIGGLILVATAVVAHLRASSRTMQAVINPNQAFSPNCNPLWLPPHWFDAARNDASKYFATR